MSLTHPIIAVTGSSGAGTTRTKAAFDHIFRRLGLAPAYVQGDSFHRYDRAAMQEEVARAEARGATLTHFGPAGNWFDRMETLFADYSERGRGQHRDYLHTDEEARARGGEAGTFTDWEELPADTDIMLYEGLHGGLVTDTVDIARYVDLLIGVVPIINLEWIQKIERDRSVRGHSAEDATVSILRRMPDYVHYICPQFSRTDINFQRIPLVDTSNPFNASAIPGNDKSLLVIHIINTEKIPVDYERLLGMLEGAWLSAPNTIVIPAGKKMFAIELLLTPVIERLAI
ncbi:MAG: phosphoribulokinase, partial [Gammaproteobacteria bacterium]|nr:phosphoribulokinase [Gammaproteobacteria bacterium]